MNLEECKNYVRSFLDTYSNKTEPADKLEWFKTYNFSKLGYSENVHEDSTKLAKTVCFIVWHDKLPLLTSSENMDKYYGGETINTFNTLFQEELEGAKQYIEESDVEFYNNVNEFKKKYLTIGNFMLLPTEKAGNLTLNAKKGFKYKDYADLFYYDLFETDNLKEFKKANFEYFKMTKNEFFEKNFLDRYLIKNNKVQIIFQHEKYKGVYHPLYWWKYRHLNEFKDLYKTFAADYMEKAANIIDYRARKIVEILQDIYK